MKNYELTIILDGKSSPAKKKAVLETLEKIIEINKGKIVKKEDWGVKELASKMGKSTSGIFLFFLLELESAAVKGINLKLKMEKEVIRHLFIREN